MYTEAWILNHARDSYENGAAQFALDPARTALLVIDMQDEFLRPEWSPFWVPAATRMMPQVASLVATSREAGIPVIWTMFDDTHHGKDRPAALSMLTHGAPEWTRPGPAQIEDGLGWLATDITIRKPSYGAFYDTPLDTILRNLGCDTVIITGTLTNYCCGTTARQAYERGYKVVFASDLTATDDESRQEAELAVLRKGFASVLTGEQIASCITARP
jgi:nicotinamidase-related amidase